MGGTLAERQLAGDTTTYYVDPRCFDNFWCTREGYIVRWSMFAGIMGIFLVVILGGYIHAKQRMRKGLPPLAYHRWLHNHQDRVRFDPSYQNQASYYYHIHRPEQYGMHSFPAPPPIYDPTSAPPPTYQPPGQASKIDPSQAAWRAEPTRRPAARDEEYAAPAGPPPAAVGGSGSANAYRL